MIEKILDKYYAKKLFNKLCLDIILSDKDLSLYMQIKNDFVCLYANYKGTKALKDDTLIYVWDINNILYHLMHYKECKENVFVAMECLLPKT